MKNYVLFCFVLFCFVLTSCNKDSKYFVNNIPSGIKTNSSSLVSDDSIDYYMYPIFDYVFSDKIDADTITFYYNLELQNQGNIDSNYYRMLINHIDSGTLGIMQEGLHYIYSTYGQDTATIRRLLELSYSNYNSQFEVRLDPCADYKDCINGAKAKAATDQFLTVIGGIFATAASGPAGLWVFVSGTATVIVHFEIDKGLCCNTAAVQAGCCTK
ncbi:MAG: hypothetical protein J5I59_08360 [Saprospiraceae bacterium]|nr:hypothetical protein [Saprospiraceae bacterium]